MIGMTKPYRKVSKLPREMADGIEIDLSVVVFHCFHGFDPLIPECQQSSVQLLFA